MCFTFERHLEELNLKCKKGQEVPRTIKPGVSKKIPSMGGNDKVSASANLTRKSYYKIKSC